MRVVMTTETMMFIRCRWCENAWFIGEADQCTCNYDNDWELVVMERDNDSE